MWRNKFVDSLVVGGFHFCDEVSHQSRIPLETRQRVETWCSHTWKTQKSFNETGILEYLPGKMRMEVAASIHLETLSNVKL